MDVIHKKYLTYILFFLFAISLLFAFQNCGNPMNALGDASFNLELEVPAEALPLGLKTLVSSNYGSIAALVHGILGDLVTELSVPSQTSYSQFDNIGDVGSSQNGPDDNIEDQIYVQYKKVYNSSTGFTAFTNHKLVILSGADFTEIRSHDLPDFQVGSGQIYPYNFHVIDDASGDSLKDILLLATKFTIVNPAPSNNTHAMILSSSNFTQVRTQTVIPISVVISYLGEANIQGATQGKEYVFTSFNNSNYTYDKVYALNRTTFAVIEIDISSLEIRTTPKIVEDLNEDSIDDFISETSNQNDTYTLEGYSFSNLNTPFFTIQTPTTESVSTTVFDYDGNGTKEIFVIMPYRPGSNFDLTYYEAAIYNLEGDEVKSLTKQSLGLSSNAYISGMKVLKDYNRDNTPEIAVTLSREDSAGLPITEAGVISGRNFETLYKITVDPRDSIKYSLSYNKYVFLVDQNINNDYFEEGD